MNEGSRGRDESEQAFILLFRAPCACVWTARSISPRSPTHTMTADAPAEPETFVDTVRGREREKEGENKRSTGASSGTLPLARAPSSLTLTPHTSQDGAVRVRGVEFVFPIIIGTCAFSLGKKVRRRGEERHANLLGPTPPLSLSHQHTPSHAHALLLIRPPTRRRTGGRCMCAARVGRTCPACWPRWSSTCTRPSTTPSAR